MNVDYNDERFQRVEQERQEELQNNQAIYESMINESQQHYKDLENQVAVAGQKQQELQQQRSDLEVQQLNQDKEWAKQDYEKEQKAAYQDYKEQSNNYGVNAERMAAQGLEGTGYSESSRVSMWNTYQNRYATARDSFNRANTQYDMAISQAKLSNDSTLANIALETLQNQLQYALEGFQYKNNLLLQQLNDKNNITDRYYSRWKDTLAQINYENELAEQQRQFEEQMAAQRSRSSGGSSGGSSSSGSYSISKGGSSSDYSSLTPGYYEDESTGATIYVDKDGNKHVYYDNYMSPATSQSTSSSSKKSSSKKNTTNINAIKTAAKIGMSLANPVIATKTLVSNTIKKLFK